MFDRFTDDARRVVVYAQEECRLLGHQHIGTEHLLLGLLRGSTSTGDMLATVGVTLAAARDRVERSDGRGRREPQGHLPFTARARRVLEESSRQAQRLGQLYIGCPHLLRGLLEVPDSGATQTLVAFEVDLDALATRVDQLAFSDEPEDRPDRSNEAAERSQPLPERRLRRLHYLPDPESRGGADVDFEELAKRHAASATALRRYARHDEGCEGERCTCGLRQVLDDLDQSPPDRTR